MCFLKSYNLSSLVSRTTKVHLTVVPPNDGTFVFALCEQNSLTISTPTKHMGGHE